MRPRRPVVADHNGLTVAAQRVVQSHCVGDKRPQSEAAVRGDVGRRIPAHERRHPVKTRVGQRRQQIPPRVSAVGEAVRAQSERPTARLQHTEPHPVRRHATDAGVSAHAPQYQRARACATTNMPRRDDQARIGRARPAVPNDGPASLRVRPLRCSSRLRSLGGGSACRRDCRPTRRSCRSQGRPRPPWDLRWST